MRGRRMGEKAMEKNMRGGNGAEEKNRRGRVAEE